METKKAFWAEWYTWHTKRIETPWDFYFLKEGNRWKNKSNPNKFVDLETVSAALQNKNENMISDFEESNVNDVLIGAFVGAVDKQDVVNQIKNLFDDAEFKRIEQVNEGKIVAIAKTLGFLKNG